MHEEFAHLLLFPAELIWVGEVLILAAAALCEEGAGCLLALGAREENLEEIGL